MAPLDFKDIILKHYARYPKLEIVDLVKLAYQAEFAGGHFIADEKAALKRLEKEYHSLQVAGRGPLFEAIGGGLFRLHLAPLASCGVALATVNRFFVNTAQNWRGEETGLAAKLAVMLECCRQGLLPFEPAKLAAYLEEYNKRGFPPVSHSEVYRSTYFPAYRVVQACYRNYFPVFAAIDSLQAAQGRVVVAIDGNSGAGKSSLADLLQAVYGCPVLHMDHFFLTPSLRTAARLREVGGNVDYERFKKEAFDRIEQGKPFQYRIYNCQDESFSLSKELQPTWLTVVEGSYSLHPTLIDGYDLKIFLEVDETTQSARILARNGPRMHRRFINEWVPLENEYFEKMGIKEKSDIVINTADFEKFN
ncbi:MAG TPA: hypothetical protein GX528_08250 [Firmicutes bacterium]|nr:hypothetical protein [Bacillota bacterium]